MTNKQNIVLTDLQGTGWNEGNLYNIDTLIEQFKSYAEQENIDIKGWSISDVLDFWQFDAYRLIDGQECLLSKDELNIIIN